MPQLAACVWVGYPNARVEMRSVHGITVAGATFPAGIWHDFMSVAHGSFCDDFPQPTTPFVAVPFFGKYAKEGAPTDPTVPNLDSKTGKDKTKRGKTNGGAGPKTYDPRLYEAPPQTAPPAPAPTPAPGNGNNGNGNGNGKSDGTTGGGAAPPPPAIVEQTQG